MKYKIYINGAIVVSTPKNIETLSSQFMRDRDLPGVFVEEILKLTFVRDGYCLLRNLQETLTQCQFPILIYKICKGEQKLVFDGLADTFTIELNHHLREASVNIRDNSLLSGLLQNREALYSPLSTTALDGITTIAPATVRNIDFYNSDGVSPSANWEGINVYEAMELLQGICDWITSNGLTVESEFFNKTYVTEIIQGFFGANANNYRRVYEIVYQNPPTINAVTTIRFRDFYGNITTLVISGIGSAGTHVEYVWSVLLQAYPIASAADKDSFTYQYDFLKWDYGTDNGTDTIVLRSFFDNEILSYECDEGPVSFSFSTDPDLQYIDSGNNTLFLTHKMMRKEGEDSFSLSFKWIIDELDRVYNILFLVQGGKIYIENYQAFQTGEVILTLNNVENLIIKSSLENIYNKLSVNDKGAIVNALIERDFISTFCGAKKAYDAETESIRSWRTIWNDIDNPDENNDKRIYMVQGESNEPTASMTITQPSILLSQNIIIDNDDYAYFLNGQLINNRQVIRHFPKFIGDLSVSPFATVINDDRAQLIYDIEFEAILTKENYRLLINNNLDNIKFKAEDSEYYIGVVQYVDYNYASGVGQFRVSGKKLATT